MSDEQIALARRAVACKGWRWMEGMRAVSPNGVMTCRVDFANLTRQPHMLPDLTDPATLGCMLALVREAHGQSTLSPVMTGRNRWCLADFGTTALDGNTEAALLVAALEAAPNTSGEHRREEER